MARVTVEDCLKTVSNRFELVVLAAQRTRQIFAGAPVKIERHNDKYPVVALREIAEDAIDTQPLRDAVTQSFRRHIQLDESEQEMADMLLEEQAKKGGAFDIGAESFEEILTEEELARSFQEEVEEPEESEEELDEEELEEETFESLLEEPEEE